jgi:hypothetical protein
LKASVSITEDSPLTEAVRLKGEKIMKAWIGYCKDKPKESLCIFAETRGKARAIAASLMSTCFIDASVSRLSSADRYYEN